MEALADLFAFLTGPPAVWGFILTGATIFVTSDRRLSLAALLMQYLLLGLTLARFLQPELAIVRVLVGVLVVPILFLTTRHSQLAYAPGEGEIRLLGLSLGWNRGPLGLPLRLFVIVLVGLAVFRFVPGYQALLSEVIVVGPGLPGDVVLVSFWLMIVGITGILVSGDALRVAPALLTFLSGFDVVYANLQTDPALVGLFGALTLLTALAFSYLGAVEGLGRVPAAAQEEATEK